MNLEGKMNILIYRNHLLQEVTTGAYFCDISNSTNVLVPADKAANNVVV